MAAIGKRVAVKRATGADEAGALLSKREIQVLHWVKGGKTNQEIGQILDISPPTVKNHLQNIMRKLNVNNRAQAVGKATTLRLVAHSQDAQRPVLRLQRAAAAQHGGRLGRGARQRAQRPLGRGFGQPMAARQNGKPGRPLFRQIPQQGKAPLQARMARKC